MRTNPLGHLTNSLPDYQSSRVCARRFTPTIPMTPLCPAIIVGNQSLFAKPSREIAEVAYYLNFNGFAKQYGIYEV